MIKPAISNRQILFLGLIAALSVLGYVLYSVQFYHIGYPLDDSWIHQTYARNLVEFKEWSFIPGSRSSGATSPLWAMLISLGYLLGISHFVWTFFLGWLALWGNGIFATLLFRHFAPEYSEASKWIGVAIVLEWHFVWAAASGMETLLFSLLVLALFVSLMSLLKGEKPSRKGKFTWGLLGAFCGVSVWIRPEGLIIFGFVILGVLGISTNWLERLKHWIIVSCGVTVSIVPYLLFNYQISGFLWPTTFYAKQAEYSALLAIPLFERIISQSGLFLVGVGVILIPGFLFLAVQKGIEKRWTELLPAGWMILHILIYAARLPVVYQHGRYMMPAMIVYLVYGFAGMVRWFVNNSGGRLNWVMGRAWVLSSGGVLLAFYFMGARNYALDVAVIESEMVAVAHWIGENTEETDLIAAHDIGALGFFSRRGILDLAGLVSPEVVPFIRDERLLKEYLDKTDASYLVAFPSLYPELVREGEIVFITAGKYSPAAGGENMTIYLLNIP